MSQQSEPKDKSSSVYPDAKTGPLGDTHASYAKPRHWTAPADSDLQSKLMFWGAAVTILGFILIVAYLAVFGKDRFLN